jgi:hypothetical protein
MLTKMPSNTFARTRSAGRLTILDEKDPHHYMDVTRHRGTVDNPCANYLGPQNPYIEFV